VGNEFKFPKGPDVERYRRAERGREKNFRASRDFERAALWLDANGYAEAAAALASAARANLRGNFWTERRIQALTIAMRADNAPDWTSEEPIATGAVLSNLASFARTAGLLLMIGQMKEISPGSAVKIRRAVALLAVAILDATDSAWRRKSY